MLVAGWIVLAVVSDPSGAPVRVTSGTACPLAAEVEGALAGLLGPRDDEAAPDVAAVSDDGDSVVVALRRASGEPVGEQRLDAGLSCDQRARAAAVIIAAWEARLGTQATALIVQSNAPAPEPVGAVAQLEAAPASATEGFRLEPGVILGGAVNGTTLAPAGAIEVAFARPGGTVVPAVSALAVGAHTVDVGPGRGSWRRFGVLATVGSRRAWSAIWAEARAGVALTVLDISGNSFFRNRSAMTFDPGVPISLRLGVRTRPVHWWIDGTIAFWPRGQVLYFDQGGSPNALPRAEALIGIGASYEGL